MNEGLECLSGVMPGGALDTMVCVRNATSEMLTIEGGAPRLRAVDTFQDMAPPPGDADSETLSKAFVKRQDYSDEYLREVLDERYFKEEHVVLGPWVEARSSQGPYEM